MGRPGAGPAALVILEVGGVTAFAGGALPVAPALDRLVVEGAREWGVCESVLAVADGLDTAVA